MPLFTIAAAAIWLAAAIAIDAALQRAIRRRERAAWYPTRWSDYPDGISATDCAKALLELNAALFRRLGPVGFLGHLATVRWGVTITSGYRQTPTERSA